MYAFKNIIQLSHNFVIKMTKVVKIANHKYPFGQNVNELQVRVQQTQFFSSVEALLEKKSEMVRKKQLLSNNGIISLSRLQVEGSVLKYEWQYIPHSISSYLRYKFDSSSHAIWQTIKNNIIKRITFQLTALMSYLANMRIQTELSTQTLGISHQEKLKLYLSPKCKMGIRSQLSLISYYGKAKERILKQIRAQLELFNINPDNLNFKVTRPYFQSKMANKSLFQSINSTSDFKKPHKLSVDYEEGQTPFKRKMSFGNFQFNNTKGEKPEREKLRQSQTPRHHKHSFQFNQNGKEQSLNGSFFENEMEAINHSKSIKIELQQTQNMNSKRKRKDSYKVKITTTREYQVDDPSIFKTNNTQDDDNIFEYFSRQHQPHKQSQSQRTQHQKEGLNTTAANSPPPSPLISAKQSPKSPSRCLEQRIRQARQRSQRVLAKMKLMKK